MEQKTNSKMIYLHQTLPIITLKENGLNIHIKRQRFSDPTKTQGPTKCYWQEMYFKYKGT